MRSTSAAGAAYSASEWASRSASTDLLTATAALFSSPPPPPAPPRCPSPPLRCLEKAALALPWRWWSEPEDDDDDDCRSHFSASSHLDGTDLLGATSWVWGWWWLCAGLARNCSAGPGPGPGVTGTAAAWCCDCDSPLRL